METSSEKWILEGYGLDLVQVIFKLFKKRSRDRLAFIVAKVTDEILVVGKHPEVKHFMDALGPR